MQPARRRRMIRAALLRNKTLEEILGILGCRLNADLTQHLAESPHGVLGTTGAQAQREPGYCAIGDQMIGLAGRQGQCGNLLAAHR